MLKFVPGGDLPSLDPILVPSYETRAHGFMVFDTLYGQAEASQGFVPRPQMLAGHTIDNDGKTWKLTLRDGLTFHDGTKVLARDCVSSIRRWSVRDPFGQTLMQRTDTLIAPDDQTIIFQLKRPFSLLPDALGKFGTRMCAIMPERLASTDPFKPIAEVIGSGPFRFKSAEQVTGSLYVYERFEVTSLVILGSADFVSGPKVAHFDRVEWHVHPDQNTAIAALQNGEVDWNEWPVEDVLPMLRRDSKITVQRIGSVGWWGLMRPNHLYPPFDKPGVRRALMRAINQGDFMQAAIGTNPALWHIPTGYFPPNSPMASNLGLDALAEPRNLGKVAQELRSEGYSGEKVVLIAPASLWRARMFSEVAAALLRQVGMNVDEQVIDNAVWARRLTSREPTRPRRLESSSAPPCRGSTLCRPLLTWLFVLTATRRLMAGRIHLRSKHCANSGSMPPIWQPSEGLPPKSRRRRSLMCHIFHWALSIRQRPSALI